MLSNFKNEVSLTFIFNRYSTLSLTRRDIDSIVCAEIPDQIGRPLLYDTVISFMLHGPCDMANPNAPCMQDSNAQVVPYINPTLSEKYNCHINVEIATSIIAHGSMFTSDADCKEQGRWSPGFSPTKYGLCTIFKPRHGSM